MIKLLDLLKESLNNDIIDVAKSIKGDRIIGSYETAGEFFPFNKKDISDVANKFNLKFKILKFPKYPKESEGVIFYKSVPNIDYILNIYLKYQRNGGQAEKLTKKENTILGKAFGFSEDEIKNFLKNIYPTITKNTLGDLIEKEAKHRGMSSKDFITKLSKDAKEVYDNSIPDEESGFLKHYRDIWGLYPEESLLINPEDFFDIMLMSKRLAK